MMVAADRNDSDRHAGTDDSETEWSLPRYGHWRQVGTTSVGEHGLLRLFACRFCGCLVADDDREIHDETHA